MKIQPGGGTSELRHEPRRGTSRVVRGVLVASGLAVMAACSPTSPGTAPLDGGKTDSGDKADGAAGGLAFQPSNVTLASIMAQVAKAEDEEITGGCSSIGISTLTPLRTCTKSPITLTEETTDKLQPYGTLHVALIVVK